MASKDANQKHSVFTAPQIMALQTQVKAFKELSIKYSEMELATKQSMLAAQDAQQPHHNLAQEIHNLSTGAQALIASLPGNTASASSRTQQIQNLSHHSKASPAIPALTKPSTAASHASVKHSVVPAPQPVHAIPPNMTPTLIAPALATVATTQNPPPPPSTAAAASWQCFGGILFAAPPATDAKKAEPLETVSVAYQHLDPYLKSNATSITLTRPYTLTLQERLLKTHVQSLRSNPQVDVWVKQRLARASLASQCKLSEAATKVVPLNPRKNVIRERKKSKRDMKAFEREQNKLRQGMDDVRRKKQMEFLRVFTAHRDEFLRFHKDKRMDFTRLARLAKQYVESADARKGREEVKAEQLRLQALKQNDMEAYSKLVDATKNERLRFLLSETDSFIQTIQQKLQAQREQGTVDEEMRTSEEAALKGTSLMGSNAVSNVIIRKTAKMNRPTVAVDTTRSSAASISQTYLEQTHRLTEKVSQPTMLKGGQLKEYQLEGLRWMISLYNNNLNGILADEMGLGKTIQTISLLAYLIEFKANRGPFMVVVPLSTLSNWVNECTKWAPDMIKVVYRGNPNTRRQIYKDEIEHGRFNVLLTTYEYIMRDKSALKRIKWQYVIVDEGHRMKNANSKFAQILGNQYHSKHRVLLTGTPLQNNLPELWALLNFLLPYIFGSMESFDQWFNQPFAAFQSSKREALTNGNDGADSDMAQLSQEERLLIVHRLHEVLRPFMLRRIKSQVLDQLPEKVEMVIRCRLSPWQKKLYKVIQERTRTILEGETKGGINNVIMQLRKVCNHPYLFLNEWYADDDLIRASGKFELLDRMLPKLKAGGHRILMFSQMTHAMTILERFFELKGFTFLRLDGGTSAEDREKRMFMFNDPESPYFIFLLSTRAGGLGLNLASADTVFIFDSDWNPMMDAQAQDRAHRIGQKNEVHVFRIITTTAIEEKILSRAAEKISLNGLVVEAGEFNMKTSSTGKEVPDDRREMMETLMREWSGEAVEEETGLDSDVPDDDQINEMMASSEVERDMYQQMDMARQRKVLEDWQAIHGPGSTPPPRLMEAHAPPAWITSASWISTNASLIEPMMRITAGGESKKRTARDFDDDFEGDASERVIGAEDYEESSAIVGRKRKNVSYSDGMSDSQFEKFLQNGGEGGESNNESPEKRVRHGDFTTEECLAIVRIIKQINKIVKPDGNKLTELFKKRPEKSFFPDYYMIIANPISLTDISQKLKKFGYTSMAELDADFDLICENARTYNEDGSFVVAAAQEVKQEFVARTAEYRRK